MNLDNKEAHPSFGQIKFSRTSATDSNFYGSDLTQGNYITMEVHQSEIYREITCDRYFETGIPLIKVRLTSGQFAELITSMNMGSGIPCTIERLMGKKVEELPNIQSKKENVHGKFEEKMIAFQKTIESNQKRIAELTSKPTLTKNDRAEINEMTRLINQELLQNIPYYTRCFQETMDKTVFEAKLEVENAILHKVNALGLSELHKQQGLLKITENE
jgi:uncharacterized protein (DUF342 family)